MTSARRRVLIVGDRRRPGVADGVRRHRARLAERVEVVGEDLDERIDLAKAEADLVLVFGGDGSILHVARRLGTNPIPVLGVNYGRFGFLADLAPEQLDEGIDRWLEGAAELHRRTRLDVTWLRSDGVGGRWLALNDVVVGRSELGRMVDVDVGIDGHHDQQFAIHLAGVFPDSLRVQGQGVRKKLGHDLDTRAAQGNSATVRQFHPLRRDLQLQGGVPGG